MLGSIVHSKALTVPALLIFLYIHDWLDLNIPRKIQGIKIFELRLLMLLPHDVLSVAWRNFMGVTPPYEAVENIGLSALFSLTLPFWVRIFLYSRRE
jgi:hypothetical protein